MSFFHQPPTLWPDRTWHEDDNGLLRARNTVLVAGEDDLPVAVLRRCVQHDDVIVAGPLASFDDVIADVEDLRPDLVLLCGTTDDENLHAAMYDLYEREGPTKLALIIRLGRATRCLPMGEFDPALDALLLHLAGEPAHGRSLR